MLAMAKSKHRHAEPGRPTPERMAKAGSDYAIGDTTRRGSRDGVLTMRDSPLERAVAREAITPAQYSAGTKYRLHWYLGGLSDALQSVDPNRVFAVDAGNFSGMARTENQVFHRQRYRAAVEELGPVTHKFLEEVVCRDTNLEDMGYALGWKSKSQAISAATERLKMALDVLKDLWGIN